MIANNDDLHLQLSTLEVKIEFLTEMFIVLSASEYALKPNTLIGLSEFIKSSLLDHVKLIEKDFEDYEEDVERLMARKPKKTQQIPEGTIIRA